VASIVEHINSKMCVAHFDSTMWKLNQLKLVFNDYILSGLLGWRVKLMEPLSSPSWPFSISW